MTYSVLSHTLVPIANKTSHQSPVRPNDLLTPMERSDRYRKKMRDRIYKLFLKYSSHLYISASLVFLLTISTLLTIIVHEIFSLIVMPLFVLTSAYGILVLVKLIHASRNLIRGYWYTQTPMERSSPVANTRFDADVDRRELKTNIRKSALHALLLYFIGWTIAALVYQFPTMFTQYLSPELSQAILSLISSATGFPIDVVSVFSEEIAGIGKSTVIILVSFIVFPLVPSMTLFDNIQFSLRKEMEIIFSDAKFPYVEPAFWPWPSRSDLHAFWFVIISAWITASYVLLTYLVIQRPPAL